MLVSPKQAVFGREFDHLESLELYKQFKEGHPLKISTIEVQYVPGKEIRGIRIKYADLPPCDNFQADGKLAIASLTLDKEEYINKIVVSVGDTLMNHILIETNSKKELRVNNQSSDNKKIVDPTVNDPEVIGFYGKLSKNGVLSLGAYYYLRNQTESNIFKE